MKLAILTSSRADFGIYLPLLKELRKRPEEFSFDLVAFGTHLSHDYGYTLNDIENEGFTAAYRIDTMPEGDDPASISAAYGKTVVAFADLWKNRGTEYDWIFALGDRYEMAAAVESTIPFGLKVAHLFGGETTLGAIDNIYRHQISLASSLHFVSTDAFAERLKQLVGEDAHCVVTGSLSLDNLESIDLLSTDTFYSKWNINLNLKPILVTVHPETIAFEKNHLYVTEVISALETMVDGHSIVITMPNADTSGLIYRKAFQDFASSYTGLVHLIENFGTQSYFTCMKYANFLLGNTSSGIVEAASFGKYVINLGDRQKGRLAGDNVYHVPFDRQQIIDRAKSISGRKYTGDNLYAKGNAALRIVETLKQYRQ